MVKEKVLRLKRMKKKDAIASEMRLKALETFIVCQLRGSTIPMIGTFLVYTSE